MTVTDDVTQVYFKLSAFQRIVDAGTNYLHFSWTRVEAGELEAVRNWNIKFQTSRRVLGIL